MKRYTEFRSAWALCIIVLSLIITTNAFAAQMQKSGIFTGPKANTGFVTMTKQAGKIVLTLSDDFVVPEAPDPHWRVFDSKGSIFDLQKLQVKNDGFNKSITLPSYIKDVAKVVIWCAFAETNLGEASFKPVS